MLTKNISLDLIIEITGLSMEEIKALQAESNDKLNIIGRVTETKRVN